MRVSGLAAFGALTIALAGCMNSTGGSARPADTTSVVPKDGLDKILLSVADINSVMGTTDLDVVESSDGLGDSLGDISDPRCLGALYNAEQTVYDGSGWIDLRDEVLTEPEGDSDHWVEQTVVKFSSAERATAFLNTSTDQWQQCVGKDVTVDDGSDQYDWRFGGLTVNGTTISQAATQADGSGWPCQHALSAVADVVVEVSACKAGLHDEALTIAAKLAANVT